MLLFSFGRNVIAFILVHVRVLVQSRVWICATLHQQITGECGRQSAAVRLQGPGLRPGTRVSQVPLQRGAGQVSRARTHQPELVCRFSRSTFSPPSLAEFSLSSSSTDSTGPFSQRHQRRVKLSSWRADHNPPPPPALRPLHPRGLLSVVTVGLFRRLTPDALWAGSALTKAKTRPYATPSPLQSHTRSSCTPESES